MFVATLLTAPAQKGLSVSLVENLRNALGGRRIALDVAR